jgi:hypothetical protein
MGPYATLDVSSGGEPQVIDPPPMVTRLGFNT